MGASAWQSAMNRRLRSISRLATAVTSEFPVSCIAFQFFLAMFAAPKMPHRSFFVFTIDSWAGFYLYQRGNTRKIVPSLGARVASN
jgi:hypothetical protein